MKRLCQPTIDGSLGRSLSISRRTVTLISFLKSYIKHPFRLRRHFAIRTESALRCNLRRQLNLSQFIVQTATCFGCATKVLSATKHHLLFVSLSQLIVMFIHFRNKMTINWKFYVALTNTDATKTRKSRKGQSRWKKIRAQHLVELRSSVRSPQIPHGSKFRLADYYCGSCQRSTAVCSNMLDCVSPVAHWTDPTT